ncbi:MAG: TonB-dependent receptor [Bacteroidetes bacterium]|nr:TonB-dependent receptor [Bacteroidota bacterium]MBU1113590.1 TonB-dependent receptor [Bacteroidota bacterium]MBU1796966.1 TonB-dependent receptor [Bacteroidota bacterium]
MNIRLTIIFLLLFGQLAFGQTTGKISGKVVDKDSGEPLVGANVLIEGTTMGGACDYDGEYFIINISPGKYNVKISMMGYAPVIYKDIQVSVNRTTTVNGELSLENLELEEIVVSVEAVSKRKDQTSSIKNVSSDQIKQLPVENVGDVIGMQAGVVDGHFRGGRLTEVSYLVDGVSVTEGFNRSGNSVSIETEAVQDLEIITGTFNAEYGRAMSGIVNIVTKEGSKDFHGSFSSSLSNYITSNGDIFIGSDAGDVTRNQDYKFQLEGPVYKDYITFYSNFRYQNNKGYLNGIRRFNVDDYSNFSNAEKLGETATKWDAIINNSKYYSEATGDYDYVPMASDKNSSFIGKLTFRPFPGLKTSLMYTMNDKEYQNYNHNYKYKPDGRRTYYEKSDLFLFQMNHVLSNSMFHDLKLSYKKTKNENYLYMDPFDSRYVATNYNSRAGGFISGGQDLGYENIELNDLSIKYDLTWQINKNHSIKTGAMFTKYDLSKDNVIVRDKKYGSSELDEFYYDTAKEKIQFNPFEPEILSSSVFSDSYNKKPVEFSTYIQDKMEYDDLVLNFGLRFDLFDSKTTYPSQYRNPANQSSFPDNPERMSTYPNAKAQSQVSPRFGLSYTLGSSAVLHFSYGHFFQMPPLYALYQNSRFLIPSGDYEIVLGNPNLKAEKTVQYEMGIWQEIMPQMGLELNVFYRDIYDLQSAIILTTYNQTKYGLFSNKDYGNVKGFELKFDYFVGPFSFLGNYTLQFTRGNADNPTSNFTRAGESLDEIPKLIPLEWDQRHTFNITVGFTQENYGINLTGYLNSGLAYTYTPIPESPLSKQTLYPNNEHKPSTMSIDIKAHYDIELIENIKTRITLSVYNLLDQLNEVRVNETTGRAYSAIVRPTEISTFKSNYNNIYDAIRDPSMYSPPREIKIGLGIVF